MELLEWIREHEVLLAILGTSGFLLFIASLIAIPLIFAYMPEDYFMRIARGFPKRKPFRHFLRILKNICGVLLLISGLILLLLPGQGILTIIIGISLIDFPGKHQLQLRLIKMPKVRNSVQWIREKVHHKPLLLPD